MIKKSINTDKIAVDKFWTILEFRLCKEFRESEDLELRHFWCDGIYLDSLDHQLRKKYINDNRRIKLIAYLGKSGQEKYTAFIRFGKVALSCYAKEKDISIAIPTFNSEKEWIEIDTENKIIEISLD